jgi:hypothetical protein
MTAAEPTTSELWFDGYLRTHGYTFDVEPDLGITKRPDRLISRDGLRAVCEVKQFDVDPFAGFRGGAIDEHKPVRRAVKEAADQLRPLKGRGLPLVVVLANPRGFHVSLGSKEVVHALYGDDSVVIPIYLGSGPTPHDFPRDDYKFIAGRNGQIRNVGKYISAVVILRHRMNEDDFFAQREHEFVVDYKKRNQGAVDTAKMLEEAHIAAASILEDEIPPDEYWSVDVIRTVSDEAALCPESFFNGPRDTLWAYDEATEIMAQVK